MTDRNCHFCRGAGWVCAGHPDRPTAMLEINGGCDCGADGIPCVCNPEHYLDVEFVMASSDPDSVRTSLQEAVPYFLAPAPARRAPRERPAKRRTSRRTARRSA